MWKALLVLLLAAPAFGQGACVKVERASDRPGLKFTGSGCVVSCKENESLVLTCWHVAPDGRRPITVVAGRAYPAAWVASDDRCDLSLLRVKATLPAADLADNEPDSAASAATEVYVCGFPGGGAYQARSGRVLDQWSRACVWTPFGPVTTADNLTVGALVQGGNSGGPVIDTAGKICGVVYLGTLDGGKWAPPATCVRLADVRRFLDRAAGPRPVDAK